MKKTVLLVLVVILLAPILVESANAQYLFVGSKESDVYHYPSCSAAQNIKPENLVRFVDAQDAVNRGYRPCKICNPPLPSTSTPAPTPKSTPTIQPTIHPTPAQTAKLTAQPSPTTPLSPTMDLASSSASPPITPPYSPASTPVVLELNFTALIAVLMVITSMALLAKAVKSKKQASNIST